MNITIQYRKNGGEWSSITISPYEYISLDVEEGDVIEFKGNNPQYNYGSGWLEFGSNNCPQASTSKYELEGNIMSLIYSDNFIGQTTLPTASTFNGLFQYCTGLTSVENLILPATTLTEGCYGSMFNGCTSLTTAPALPATNLANSCYSDMFQSCTSLTAAPALPATTLAESCYFYMFSNCTGLTTAPALPATTLANTCYWYMFRDCTSLTTAPELPATTLESECYGHMFYGCTSLNYIKCLATDISAEESTNDWVSGVSSTGTFVKAATMTDWTTGNNGIPTNWTVQDDS